MYIYNITYQETLFGARVPQIRNKTMRSERYIEPKNFEKWFYDRLINDVLKYKIMPISELKIEILGSSYEDLNNLEEIVLLEKI